MTFKKPEVTFVSTGDRALDQILGGGIPSKSVVAIVGEPGSGKTVLTLQMLFRAARQGKKCLYFTTVSEPAIKVIRFMQMFDFFDATLIDKNVVFVDLVSVVREGAEKTLEAIEQRVEQYEPDLVAIDSIRAVGDLLRTREGVRSFIYDLAVKMTGWGATTFLVGEYTRDELPVLAEFAVADGILRLASQAQDLTSTREFEVLKMRGTAYSSGRHFYEISSAGVSFYARVSAPDARHTQPPADFTQRASTGIAGLDDLLGGGLPRGTTTLVEGATGAGKTLVSLTYLVEGARRNEKGVLFTLEETPEQIRGVAASIGLELEAFEKRGLIAIQYASPVELSTDRFLFEVRNQVAALGAKRASFDSLTTLSLGVPSERRFKELVYAIAKHLRSVGVTLMMTSESPQLIGATQLTARGVSFVADNVIQLRYVEIGGRLERAISVLKARGIAHGSELRSMNIDSTGVSVVAGRFTELRGVLTGLPTPADGDPT